LTAILSPNGTRQKFRPVRPRAHHDLAIRIGTVVVAKSFVFRYVFDPHHVASDTGSMNHPYSHILPWRTEEQRLHTVDSPDVIPVERTINPHSQYRSTTYSNQLPRSDRSRTLSVTVRVACHGVRRNRRVFCVSRPVSHVAGLKVVIFSTTTADVKARTQRSGSRDLCLSGSAAEVDLLLMGTGTTCMPPSTHSAPCALYTRLGRSHARSAMPAHKIRSHLSGGSRSTEL
jgi:hypothetical protein